MKKDIFHQLGIGDIPGVADVLAKKPEQDTEPLRAVGGGRSCGVRGCTKSATKHPCETCGLPVCSEHLRSRRANGEQVIQCSYCTGG
jgi:hypothetical protein